MFTFSVITLNIYELPLQLYRGHDLPLELSPYCSQVCLTTQLPSVLQLKGKKHRTFVNQVRNIKIIFSLSTLILLPLFWKLRRGLETTFMQIPRLAGSLPGNSLYSINLHFLLATFAKQFPNVNITRNLYVILECGTNLSFRALGLARR